MSDDTMLRLFFGIPVEGDAREKFLSQIEPSFVAVKGLKWTKPEQWHVTVVFLGDVPDEKLDELIRATGDAVRQHSIKRITLDHAGSFRKGEGGILWIGALFADEVARLCETLYAACKPCAPQAPAPHRPFQAHVTVGRVKYRSGHRRELDLAMEVFRKRKIEPVVLDAPRLVLYKSELTSEGPIHTEVKEWRL